MDAYEQDREANAVGIGGGDDNYWPEEWLDEKDLIESCPHTDAVRWNAAEGRFECSKCQPIEFPAQSSVVQG